MKTTDGRNKCQSGSKKRPKGGQSMVEFALVLPILLILIVGIIEAARLVFMYGSVVTASREAARYGSTNGLIEGETDYFRYQDCAGIIAEAEKVTFLTTPSNVEILYDLGPNPPAALGCSSDPPVYPNEEPPCYQYCKIPDGIDPSITVESEVDDPASSDPADTIPVTRRIVVTVEANYAPVVPNLIPQFLMNAVNPITSTSSKTYLGTIKYWP